MRWILTISTVAVVLLGALGLLAWYAYKPQAPKVAGAPSTVATRPVSPATQAAPGKAAARIVAYGDLLKSLPSMADATIGDSALPLEQAARIHLPYHSYVCPRGDLWIAHPEAPTLLAASDEGTRGVHLTQEEVVFVHWAKAGRQMRSVPIYRDAAGAFRVFRRTARQDLKLQRFDYHWADALSVGDVMAVPTDQGIAAIRISAEVTEEYRELSTRPDARVQVALTPEGFIASSDRAAHFAGGKWNELGDDWQGPFIQLVPFDDGSVLQIRPAADDRVSLRIAALEMRPADAKKVKELVAALADEDQQARDQAHEQLVALGPAAWRMLEELKPTLAGEAMVRVDEIIASRTRPTLGRMRIAEDRLLPVWYLRDGIVYLAGAGVSGGRPGDPLIVPAWIAVRRGMPISLLPSGLSRGLAVGSVDLDAEGTDWICSDSASGAKLYFGQELLPLTKEKDVRFRKLAGIDRNSRVLLSPVDGGKFPREFILVDPAVADPTPVLQVWEMSLGAGEVGWNDENWPVVKRGQAYVLKRDAWEPLKGELKESVPAPTTAPGSVGVMTLLAKEGQVEIWSGGGELELRSGGKSAKQARPNEVPPGEVAGVLNSGKLYLLHRGGKLTRLTVTAGSAAPFRVDAVFTEGVPDFVGVKWAWIDPDGRLCAATEDARMIVVFLDRKIPPAMLDMIPGDELRQARPGEK